MKFVFDDGGRAEAGYKGLAGDCVVRAVAIAAELPYQDVYDALSSGCRNERKSYKRSARNGVHTKEEWFKQYMSSLGWEWVPIMGIGTGCMMHLCSSELPMGRIIVRVSKHYVAVIDGVIHDLSDCSRGGTRCVYGYWRCIRVPRY